MFSGIVEHQAKILDIQDGLFCVQNTLGEIPTIGQSIAHDGACMTITEASRDSYCFFAMEESFRLTNFSKKKTGDFFNVERCIRLGDRIDGHMVSGHIDTTGTVMETERKQDDSLILSVGFSKEFANYVISKGSITINGVSLTVVEDGDDFLTVSLIPLTQSMTNLGKLAKGDTVNLEFDTLAKYIHKLMHK